MVLMTLMGALMMRMGSLATVTCVILTIRVRGHLPEGTVAGVLVGGVVRRVIVVVRVHGGHGFGRLAVLRSGRRTEVG